MDIAKTTSTMEQSDRLMAARCRLMTRCPFYGHISMSMQYIPSNMPWMPEERRTMGVRIVNGGEIQCLYYPPFVEKLTIKELFAVIQHEIEHIVRVHCVRIGHRNPEAWNVACDMAVNGKRSKPRIGYIESGTNEVILPMKGNICWIPEDWDENQSSEQMYDGLIKRQTGKCCGNCGKPIGGKGSQKGKSGGSGDKDGDKQDGSGGSNACPTCGQDDSGDYNYGNVHGKQVDDHSVWNQTDVSADEARQVIKDVVDQAAAKNPGDVPGHLSEAIKELAKPVVRWRELLRHYLGKHVGSERKTYSRRNRRHDWFGMPGISHHAAATVNVIVDTSGSVGQKELQQFFAEIDMISSKALVWVLQWDHAFQGYKKYRRNDWKSFAVHGRGGTDMCKPVEWLIDNRLIQDVQILLTDGYCQYASEKKFPMITVITTGPDVTKGPGWGHEVRLKAAG